MTTERTISVVNPSEAAACILAGFHPISFAELPRQRSYAAIFSVDARPALDAFIHARDKIAARMGKEIRS